MGNWLSDRMLFCYKRCNQYESCTALVDIINAAFVIRALESARILNMAKFGAAISKDNTRHSKK